MPQLPFSEMWAKAQSEIKPSKNSQVDVLIKFWAESILKAQIASFDFENGYWLYLLDLSKLMVLGLDMNVVAVAKEPKNEKEKNHIYSFARKYAQQLEAIHSICFITFLSYETCVSKSDWPEDIDVVVLDGQRLERIIESKFPKDELFEEIRSQVSVSKLCPFDTTTIAIGKMFVGRNAELRRLTQDVMKNSLNLISGARRIGKSSFLNKIKDIITANKKREFRVVNINCRNWYNLATALEDIANKVSHRIRWQRILKEPLELKYILKQESNDGANKIIFLFDEFDNIVRYDEGANWKLMSILMDSIEEGYIIVYIAGFSEVNRLDTAENSPMRLKIKRVDLGPLKENETRQLIISPFKRISIRCENVVEEKKIIKKVHSACSGMPFMIQFYGFHIFNSLIDKNKKNIELQDVIDVENANKFILFLKLHFDENAQDFDFIVAVVIATLDSKRQISEGELINELLKKGIEFKRQELSVSLRRLKKSSILKYENQKYSFLFKALRKIIVHNYGSVDLKKYSKII